MRKWGAIIFSMILLMAGFIRALPHSQSCDMASQVALPCFCTLTATSEKNNRGDFSSSYPCRRGDESEKDNRIGKAGIDSSGVKDDILERVNKRTRECRRLVYLEKDLSPGIVEILNKNISDLESIGAHENICLQLEILGNYHFLKGDNSTGADYLREAVLSARENGNKPAASRLYGKLGSYYARMGKLDAAERCYGTAIEMAREVGDPYHLSRSYSFMATLRASEGFFLEAESLHQKAIRYSKATGDTLSEATRTLALARLYKSFGEIDRALHLAERVLLLNQNWQRDSGDNIKPSSKLEFHHSMASALNLIAEMQLINNRPRNALKNMKKALAMGRRGIDRHNIAKLEIYLGDIYTRLGITGEAEKYYRRAIRQTRDLGTKRRSAEYISALAEMYHQNGENDKARKLLTEALRLSVDQEYWMQEIHSALLAGKVEISLDNQQKAKEFFLRALRVFSGRADGENYFARRHPMWRIISELFKHIYALECDHFNNNDSLLFYSEIHKQLHGTGPVNHLRPRGSLIAELLNKRSWIPEDCLILEHLILEDRVVILGIDQHHMVRRMVWEKPERVEKLVLQFYHSCISAAESDSPDIGRLSSQSRELYRLLLEPVSSLIKQKQRIVLVEDGILEYLPFHALVSPDNPESFLVETKQIAYSPRIIPYHLTAGSLDPGSQCEKPSRPSADIDMSAYDKKLQLPADLKNILIVGDINIAPGLKKIYPHLSGLPWSVSEIDSVGRLLGSENILRGEGADKISILAGLKSADAVHIATHTINYPVYGGRTALVVSPSKEINGEKELCTTLVTIEDIQGLSIDNCSMVVLSSCESAGGKPLPETGEPDLAEAFLRAGAKAVIAPIWPVEDRSIKELCIDVYRELLSGRGNLVEALNCAQRKIIRKDKKTNPWSSIWKWGPLTINTFPRGLEIR